jgi:hypothetical protein
MELFKEYDPEVQRVISEVLTLEQEHISLERPRVKNLVRQIIDHIVQDESGDQE